MLVGAVWIGLFVSGCDRGQGNAAVPSREERDSKQLTAIADPEPAPTFGNHKITGKDRRLYTMMPGRDVRKFKQHIREKLGVVIPESSGSYVARLGRYPGRWDPPPNYELDPDRLKPDNFDSHNLAFMMPVEKASLFLEHLKECGHRLKQSRGLTAGYSIGEHSGKRSFEELSFQWPEGCHQADFWF